MWVSALVATSLAAAASAAAAQSRYVAKVIGQPVVDGHDIWLLTPGGVPLGGQFDVSAPATERSAAFTRRGVREFRPLGSPQSQIRAASHAGDVAGVLLRPSPAAQASYVRRADGTTTAISLQGAHDLTAAGVNSSGLVVGSFTDASERTIAFQSVDGVVTPRPSALGGISSTMFAVNDAGLAVGASEVAPSVTHATEWLADGTAIDLGTLQPGGFSQARGITPDGVVMGLCGPSMSSYHACLWRPGHGPEDLGTLPGDAVSLATSINASGAIVGDSWAAVLGQPFRAVIWHDGQVEALENLTTLPEGVSQLFEGSSIADDGSILALGTALGGDVVYVLLTPVAGHGARR